MKMTAKGVSTLVVAMLLAGVLLAGCGGQTPQPTAATQPANTQQTAAVQQTATAAPTANALDTSKEVKLKMYLLGDHNADCDLVYGEVNKMLKQDINATVEVSFMSWSDYQQKYPLVFASGEDFDLIYSASWCFYNAQAVKGAYKEITQDMLKTYMPKTAETMYPAAWSQAKVNDKVYMIPMNYKELNPYVFMVRGDLMEKYNIPDIKSIEDFGSYLDAVAKNEPQLIPCDIGSDQDCDALFWTYGQGLIKDHLDVVGARQTLMGYDSSDKTAAKLFLITQTPGFASYVKLAKEWKDKGYWSKSALVNKTNVQNSFVGGKSASAILNANTASGTFISTNQAHPDWKIKVFDAMNGKGVIQREYTRNGMSINANSKNVERSLMTLELFRNDERYFDLTTYGIKGTHYDLTSDNSVKPLDATANYPIDGNCNWGWRSDKLFKKIDGGIPNLDELRKGWADVATTHPMQFFNFDDSSVTNEVAACNNIFNTSYKALIMGFTDDTDGDIAKLNDKYKQAGIDKILAAAQVQVDEFIKNFKQ